MKAVLDSSVVVDVFRGKIQLATIHETYDEVYLTTVGMGELFYGAYHSNDVELHLAECVRIQEELPVLTIDRSTSRIYGNIKQRLRRAGQMIPENDLWFAAIALANHATIVTKDKHFERVDNLIVHLV